ncbi:hypothetical protein BS50DRAFT_207495 [Corynespora cassiicola Philippines]|uniref:Uncharacterized protein n=1 Tax=Corynespora cassiicola Philippines TaxID=1448308 RepID=A0A2T2N4N3_CORCC|nr:hypothetical protein BS50DRAFT_207495 [Corynespora cassiicola Philippines]
MRRGSWLAVLRLGGGPSNVSRAARLSPARPTARPQCTHGLLLCMPSHRCICPSFSPPSIHCRIQPGCADDTSPEPPMSPPAAKSNTTNALSRHHSTPRPLQLSSGATPPPPLCLPCARCCELP